MTSQLPLWILAGCMAATAALGVVYRPALVAAVGFAAAYFVVRVRWRERWEPKEWEL